MNTNATTRRQFLAVSAAATAASAVSVATAQAQAKEDGPFSLPDLPYTTNALEPHIDAMTMGIHHGKHHQAYVTNLNKAVSAHSELTGKTLEQLLTGLPFIPESARTAVRNNGGGHWNHTFFWESMAKPAGDGENAPPDGPLAAAITKTFESFGKFQEVFADAAAKRFGSGWAWLVAKANGELAVVSTPNQDNPLMQGIVANSDRGAPLLGIDVWEHAYYLKYQNRRADYIGAWWNVVNWRKVAERYDLALKAK